MSASHITAILRSCKLHQSSMVPCIKSKKNMAPLQNPVLPEWWRPGMLEVFVSHERLTLAKSGKEKSC